VNARKTTLQEFPEAREFLIRSWVSGDGLEANRGGKPLDHLSR
jgi:hypothetical protein